MDVFDTAALRERVLAAWSASPARFREDANAEDELARGSYRDRVVVELAQNAADAGARAGLPVRLLLRLAGSTLLAANTGAPLDAAGAEGLSTLRASAKRDGDTVGRFGVGFAAVLAVTDEPRVLTAPGGGLRWSRSEARAAAASVPGLAAELARRGDDVPVLRLPFPASGAVPDGYDTAVELPLRDDEAVRLVRRLLTEIDDALLLALPWLGELVVDVDGEVRRLDAGAPVQLADGLVERRIGARTWRLATRAGVAPDELLADRPFEERSRPGWSVTVAVPVGDDTGGRAPVALPPSLPAVVHAPTPTDDRTDLPALVIAGLPLDSSRRRVVPGPLLDDLADQVGAVYARLVASFVPPVPGPAVLALVPGPLGLEAVDAVLHRAVRTALAATPFVPGADGSRLRPGDVTLVDGLSRTGDPAALGGVVRGLPVRDWWRPEVLAGLGTTVTPLADVVDELAAERLAPAGWRALYDALDGSDHESLGALPVPLADGRLVRGPRGLLVPGEVRPELLAPFDLRVVAPEAVHPLLYRLGAVDATAASVLRDPLVQGAVADLSEGDDDPAPVAEAVLGLLAESGLDVADEPWLAGLPLADATGAAVPARELLLPGSPLLAVLDADPAEFTVAPGLVARFGPAVLRAAGVRDGFAVVRDADVTLEPDTWHDLDDEDRWVDDVLASLPAQPVPPLTGEFAAVADLDLVRGDAWAQVLEWLAADADARAAVVSPLRLTLADGGERTVPSYTAWWLRRHARIGGRPLTGLALPGADALVRALLPVAEVPVDDAFAAAVGLAREPGDLDPDAVLSRLAEDDLELPAATLSLAYAALAAHDPAGVRPPDRIRVPDGIGSRVVPAGSVVVCDGPHWLQLGLPGLIHGPAALADLLDVDLASEVHDATVHEPGRRQPVPDIAHTILGDPPPTYVEHDDLVVAGTSVDWWPDGDDVHAATLDGLARGLAWVTGQWAKRWVLAEALADPDALPALLADDAFD
ncbi:sacsin N-terminal ATP-binding-like domain-containing protein [Jiangella alkaliphila]|uniref:Molecular chaperone Hsp90 n=1 Tax=Jiangella alkaliphila TaxID=419479 RepID=A0A1H2ILG3_9ACTN|nr:hypothetical protein [Jiangella alkaliphila]SDU44923.1 hypothetical protein SAMN04488563_1822 [Jiangella alkaliphila]